MSYTTVGYTPGTGVNFNVDRISSNDFQRVKVAHGAEGSATDVSAASPMPVSFPDYSTRHIVLAATTNATSIKTSAGTLKGLFAFSKRATPFYVRFHNTAGTPTAGIGVVIGFGVQAGIPLYVPIGMAFSTGIGVTVVTGITLTDATAVAAEDGEIVVFYV